jgi:hypothetical protein
MQSHCCCGLRLQQLEISYYHRASLAQLPQTFCKAGLALEMLDLAHPDLHIANDHPIIVVTTSTKQLYPLRIIVIDGVAQCYSIVSITPVESVHKALTSTSSQARPCTFDSSSIVMILPVVTIKTLASKHNPSSTQTQTYNTQHESSHQSPPVRPQESSHPESAPAQESESPDRQ